MKNRIWIFSLLALASCTGPGQGMMVQFDSTKPIDNAKLDRACDIEDTTACFLANKPLDKPLDRLPVVQGMAPTGKAVFSILLYGTQVAKWYLLAREPLSLSSVPVKESISHPGSLYRLERLELSGLEAKKKYEMIAVDVNGMILDQRYFETFSTEGTSLRFALVSCADDSFQEDQSRQWNNLLTHEPEAIFAIGDNVYATSRGKEKVNITEASLWERYSETRTALDVFYQPKLTPFFATWDDHDYGMNNGDQTFPLKESSRKIMEAFFPTISDAKTVLEGPGVSRALKARGQTFILMDDRTFRSPNQQPPVCQKSKSELCPKTFSRADPDGTHFGRVQEDWAFSVVAKTNGPVWLVSGDQWFGGYQPFESYEGNHPQSFGRFMEGLSASLRQSAKAKLSNSVIFASGDRHLSEIMKVRPFKNRSYQTYEITSSGIHARTYPSSWKEFPNSRQIVGKSDELNFSIIQSEANTKGALTAEIKSMGHDNQPLFEQSLQVKALTK